MVKLWISDKLELRWNEWPDKKSFVDYENDFHVELYNDALAKAKKESIPVDGGALPGSLTYTLMTAQPDTFIEFAGEVEVINQHKYSDEYPWEDIPAGKAADVITWHTRLRKVARLKPVNKSQLDSACEKIPAGHIQCPRCHGSGETTPDVTCKKCEGSGYVEKPVNSAMSFTEGSDPGVGQYYDKAHGAEPVLIGAGPPEIASLKSRILEAFRVNTFDEFPTATMTLEKVLDELNIK